MNYSPRNAYVWDAWYVQVGDVVHAYHLQSRRPEAPADFPDAHLGHAVSTDLIHWSERPAALAPNPADPHDDRQPWTGCALWHGGRGYLFYTMRGSADGCRQQAIGLATGSDPDAWQRHPDNPVIVPDPRWYATALAPTPGVLDCRDLSVVRDEAGGWWYGFFATRVPGDELAETAAIGCARSRDLVRWEQLPPAFVPRRYACVEVPDVFRMGDRWYMTFLTGTWYGNRGICADPNQVGGTMYAMADRPEGPYRLPADPAFIAGRTTVPLTCKTIVSGGERHVLYTDRERIGRTDGGDWAGIGTLATPKLVRTDGERLHAAWCPRVEVLAGPDLVGAQRPPVQDAQHWGQLWPTTAAPWTWGEVIRGEMRLGWSVALLRDVAVGSCLIEATVVLERGTAAGIAFRVDGAGVSGSVVALDADAGEVVFAEATAFDYQERRRMPIPRGVPLRLRVVSRREHVEVYVDDELRLAFCRYRALAGRVGLFVDRGRAHFSAIRIRGLTLPHGADLPG